MVPHDIQDKSSAAELAVTQGRIIFSKVKFHYRGSTSLFQNKSVTIAAGQKVGLVGYSGSGKSTFVNLILRLYDIVEGQILIDGQNLSEITQESLRRAIGMIPQDPTLFHPQIAQGVRGAVGLVTGNFSFFTKEEVISIQKGLNQGKVLVLVYDRDSISVPANERAMWIRRYFNHDTNLEVRVAYGPPSESKGNEALYFPYIKRQIPTDISVASIYCNNRYSPLLAKQFGVPYFVQPAPFFEEVEELQDLRKTRRSRSIDQKQIRNFSTA